MIKRKLVVLLASVAVFWTMTEGSRATDMETIRQRVCQQVLQDIDADGDAIKAMMDAQATDGSWGDVDYAARDRASWPPIMHLTRLRQMATAYHQAGHQLEKDKALGHAITLAMEYWLTRDPLSDNWWWNEIGAPRSLGVILLLMRDELGEILVRRGASKLAEEPYMTGQNRVWLSELVIERGLLEDNPERVASGVSGIRETIAITDEEGIQVDGTFYQHGNLIYNGGYGRGYLTDVSRWGHFLRATAYAFDEQVSDILASLILDGTGWMVRYGTIDFSVTGRELVRKNSVGMAETLVPALNQMMAIGDKHAPRYRALLNHITRKSEAYPYIEGHKHFWRADYTVNRQAEFLVSLRSFSGRTIGGEIINKENLLGFYLPFGTTLIYRDGTEYDHMMPVWDWRKLPGTTIEQAGEAPVIASGTGQSRFVGGVSNGRAGMSVFNLYDDRDPVSARKSWFFFDEGFVALAADIHCSTDNSVFTTLNQCRLNSTDNSVLVSDGDSRVRVPRGERILPGVSWVYHDGVGYILPDQPDVYLKNDTQSGSRGSISKVYPMDMESREVFLLGIDHGPARQPRDYVYCVLPIGDVNAVEAFAADNPIRVLSNTYKVQAVQHVDKGLTGITFYRPGSIEIEAGRTLSVDTACLVLIENSGPDGQSLEISVANPVGTGAEVRVRLTGCLTGKDATFSSPENRTEILFQLPGGSFAGSSVSKTFQVDPGK